MQIRRPRKPTDFTLNITSMMDMFTIILVFLLFSFKSQDETFTMAPGIKLPQSTSVLELQDALNIQMSADALIVPTLEKIRNDPADARVLPLQHGRLPRDVEMDGPRIVPLYEAIKKAALIIAEDAKVAGRTLSEEKRSIVIFQADRRVRYEDIDKVMKTAALAGFPNFRFAVMKK